MSRIKLGNIKGPKGETGVNGLNGTNGKDGVGIESIAFGEAEDCGIYYLTPITITLTDGKKETFELRSGGGGNYIHNIRVSFSAHGSTDTFIIMAASDSGEAITSESAVYQLAKRNSGLGLSATLIDYNEELGTLVFLNRLEIIDGAPFLVGKRITLLDSAYLEDFDDEGDVEYVKYLLPAYSFKVLGDIVV